MAVSQTKKGNVDTKNTNYYNYSYLELFQVCKSCWCASYEGIFATDHYNFIEKIFKKHPHEAEGSEVVILKLI